MDHERDEPVEPEPSPPVAASARTSRWPRRRATRAAGRAARERRKAPWWELPALVGLAVLVAIGVKSFLVQPFYIPSGSMEHTLHGCPGCSGDRILVDKPIYDFRDPHPGDIVVFHAPPGWDDEPASRPPSNPVLRTVRGFGQLVGLVPPDGEVLVKRVIAVGGETVKGDAQGHVMVSTHGPAGPFRALVEPYVYTPKVEQLDDPAFGPVTVPQGRLWVEGDHRSSSEDSRYHCSADGKNESGSTAQCATFVTQATVPIDDVIGKAVVIAWPPSRWRTLGTPSTFTKAADAAGPALPGLVPVGAVIPVFLLRRRRRRPREP